MLSGESTLVLGLSSMRTTSWMWEVDLAVVTDLAPGGPQSRHHRSAPVGAGKPGSRAQQRGGKDMVMLTVCTDVSSFSRTLEVSGSQSIRQSLTSGKAVGGRVVKY